MNQETDRREHMKTKLFKHKLLTAGAVIALGLGVSLGAQSAPEAYAVSLLRVTNFSQTVDLGNPENIILFDGIQSSETDCSSTETPTDGDSPIAGFPAPPPFPVGLNAKVANCNTPAASTRAEDNFNERGKIAGIDYGNGDAAIFLTNIIVNGEASSIAEAYLQTVPLPGGNINYKGGGNNVVTVNFELVEDTQITYSLDLDYRNFAELMEASLPSAATAQSSFEIAITDDAGNQVFEFIPLDSSQSNASASPDNPEDGQGMVQSGSFSKQTPVIGPGLYQLKITMKNDANVRLQIPPEVPGDHFLCYKSFGHFLREKVRLTDQFEDKNFEVLKPKMFCNPAIKPELDPDAELGTEPHYLSYKIKKSHREPRHERKIAQVQNQFGTMIVETFRPDRLMVPSGKSLELDNPAAIPVPGPNANHYKCYTVKATGFQTPGEVAILDQFTDADGKKLRIVRPKRLCTPVEKTRSNGDLTPVIEDPNNEFDHLMCYSVAAAAGERFNPRTKILSSNQFGNEELVLKRELEFCVPTKKTLLRPEG